MIDNLDLECATCAQEIAEVVGEENTIGKALGVLQENGVYAFYLYLLALEKKSKYKDKSRSIINQSTKLLRGSGLIANSEVDMTIRADNVKGLLTPLAERLDQLFFAKQLLERTLVYARYHAKALQGDDEDGGM
jgi:hypothetical protein